MLTIFSFFALIAFSKAFTGGSWAVSTRPHALGGPRTVATDVSWHSWKHASRDTCLWTSPKKDIMARALIEDLEEVDGSPLRKMKNGLVAIAARLYNRKQPGTLVLVRHGESDWNNNKTFIPF